MRQSDSDKQTQDKPCGFTKKIGRTHYIVQLIFNPNSKETLSDKTQKLIWRDVTKGNSKRE